MNILLEKDKYKPSEVARYVGEVYGHNVTPSGIRKWDSVILSQASGKTHHKAETRMYTRQEVEAFNVIALLRGVGYSLSDVAEIFKRKAENPGQKFDEIKYNLDKIRKSIEKAEEYLSNPKG